MNNTNPLIILHWSNGTRDAFGEKDLNVMAEFIAWKLNKYSDIVLTDQEEITVGEYNAKYYSDGQN